MYRSGELWYGSCLACFLLLIISIHIKISFPWIYGYVIVFLPLYALMTLWCIVLIQICINVENKSYILQVCNHYYIYLIYTL
jgi:hypothetical protein